MKLNKTLFVLVATSLFAVAARAQDQAVPATPAADAPAAAPAAMPDQKGDWKSHLKDACSAEIADGGVCANKEFGAGLEHCLERHMKKETDGCRKAVRKHRRHWMHKMHEMHKDGDQSAAPADAPAPAPAQ